MNLEPVLGGGLERNLLFMLFIEEGYLSSKMTDANSNGNIRTCFGFLDPATLESILSNFRPQSFTSSYGTDLSTSESLSDSVHQSSSAIWVVMEMNPGTF